MPVSHRVSFRLTNATKTTQRCASFRSVASSAGVILLRSQLWPPLAWRCRRMRPFSSTSCLTWPELSICPWTMCLGRRSHRHRWINLHVIIRVGVCWLRSLLLAIGWVTRPSFAIPHCSRMSISISIVALTHSNSLQLEQTTLIHPTLKIHNLYTSRHDRRRHKQFKTCPEQDCEELVYMFNQKVSMIELLELHEEPEWRDRVAAFKQWYKYSSKDTWTWETKDHKKDWNRGSSKRSQSMPVTLEERRTDPVEKALPWRDIGDAIVDPAFLWPVSEDNSCPISQSRKMSKADAKQCIQWILTRIPDIDRKRDERVYCADCDMKNHPRFPCNHYYKQ